MDKISKWGDIDYEKYTKEANKKRSTKEVRLQGPEGVLEKVSRMFAGLFSRNPVPAGEEWETIHSNQQQNRSFGCFFWKAVDTDNRRK